MGDTFNAFVKFISDDPIMLGLCIAIIVLVIMFIIVLIVGRNKDSKKEKIEDNSETMKTDINLETVSTTTPAIEPETNREQNQITDMDTFTMEENTPTTEPLADSLAEDATPIEATAQENIVMEVPVTNEEPVALEIPIEDAPNIFDVQPEPIVPNEQVIEEPISEAPLVIEETADTKEKSNEEAILDITEPEPLVIEPETIPTGPPVPSFEDMMIKEPLEPSVLEPAEEPIAEFPVFEEPQVAPEPLDESTISPIIESSVNPIDDRPIENTLPEETLNIEVPASFTVEEKEEPILPIELPAEPEVELPATTEPIPTIETPLEEPYNSVYLEATDFKPDFNIEDFDKTAILRHMPVMESLPTYEKESKKAEPKSAEADLDDIVLPKLNTNNEASALNALKGESFDIN